MTIKAYYVRFDSTNYQILEFEHTEGGNKEVDVTTIELSRTHDSVFNIGDDVQIGYLDATDTFVADFKGDITNKEKHETLTITVESYGGRINRSEHLSIIYEDKSPEYIVEDLIDNYVDGLTYASTTSSNKTIDNFVVDNETVGEAITRILNELDWQIRVDGSKNFYFEPSGEQGASVNLTVGSNAFMDSNWKESPSQLINYVSIVGDTQRFQTSKTFASASADQTEFEVDYKIVGNVKVTVDGTEKVGGSSSSTSSYDYSVDKEQKTITFESGMTGGEEVIVYYEYELPVKLSAANDNSISTYTRFPKRFTDKNLKSMAQARDFAKKVTKLYGVPRKSGTLILPWDSDVSVGETVTIIDEFNDVNQEFVILSKKKKYPDGIQTIEVGVEEVDLLNWNKTTDIRIKNLESKQDNSNLTQIFRAFKESLDVVTRQGRTRTRTQNIYNDSYDSFILGHSDNGKLGTQTGIGGNSIVLGDYRSGWTVTAVSNPEDIMYERFNFTTYIDTGNTTATIDTTNEQAEFTNGEVAQSLAVAKRTADFGSATLTADSTTNLTFQMSADGGSNWENVTSGEAHTFTDDGNELRWKATASGVATLGEIKIEY